MVHRLFLTRGCFHNGAHYEASSSCECDMNTSSFGSHCKKMFNCTQMVRGFQIDNKMKISWISDIEDQIKIHKITNQESVLILHFFRRKTEDTTNFTLVSNKHCCNFKLLPKSWFIVIFFMLTVLDSSFTIVWSFRIDQHLTEWSNKCVIQIRVMETVEIQKIPSNLNRKSLSCLIESKP